VGTGVAGLTCTHVLRHDFDVTVFEAAPRPGGHTNTVSIALPEGEFPVDTGFIVYNEPGYPGLVRLLAELDVVTKPSDMSFSVADEATGLEYRGTSFSTVFAQRRNLARPAFLRMLGEVARFNRLAHRLLDEDPGPDYTLRDMLDEGRWSSAFVDWYLVPLGSSIWSADPTTFTDMPASTLARFFDRHGLLSIGDKPDWRTVAGGARHYVDAILAPVIAEGRLRLSSPVLAVRRSHDGVELRCEGSERWEEFDHLVLATHSDEALAVLQDPSPEEKEVLSAVCFQPNSAVLHTDRSFLPRQQRAWASWNFHRRADQGDRATLTYYMNFLQGIPSATPVLLTLNQDDVIDPGSVVATFDYAHPVMNAAAVDAQGRHHEVSGVNKVSYAGAYWGYGFHEDGVQSALRVCEGLGVTW